MNLYDAMFVRQSVKHYSSDALDQKLIENLLKFAESLSCLDDKQEVEFRIVDNTQGNGHIPYFLLITAKETEDYLLNVGYIACQISLYLTAKGIGSGFLSMHKPELEALEGCQYPFALALAFGKAKDNVYCEVKKIRRQKLDDLAFFKEDVSNNVKSLLKAAILAPSNFNSQPWRFVVYENRIHLFVKEGAILSKRFHNVNQLSIGIMLAYLFIAAEEFWMEVSTKHLDNIAEKSIKGYEYVISVLIK